MSDQDRKPEEEPEVEGHIKDDGLMDDGLMAAKDDDDVEAHALREELADEMYARDELNEDLA